MAQKREREYDVYEGLLHRIRCHTSVEDLLTTAEIEAHRSDYPLTNQKVQEAREKVSQEVQKLVATRRYDDARQLIDEYEELAP